MITLKQNLAQFFLILSLLIIGTIPLFAQDTSSSDFCQIAEMTGGTCVKITKPEEGEDDPTISCSAFNIIIGTIRPSITSISPLKIPVDSTADLLITAPNANFNSSSTVRIEKIGEPNKIEVLSATQIKANVTIPPTADRQFYDVFVDTTVGTETETAEGRCALEVIEKSYDVQILSINPSKMAQGSTTDLEIYGNNTDFSADTPVIDFGDTRITTTDLAVHTPTHLTATINVDSNVPTGFYHLTITTNGEIAKDIEPGGAFLVLSSDFKIPTIDSLTPAQVQQGKTIENLSIIGDETHFNSNSSLNFSGEGISVTAIEVKDTTQILATVDIAQEAAPGSRDIFVTTGSEIATGLKLFEIQLNAGPTDITLSNKAINEDKPNNTIIGTFHTTDPDDETHHYELENNAGGRFKIVDDQLQIADTTLLTANNLVSHPIQVISTDNGGKPISANFTINVNYAPKDITLSNTTTIERSGEGIIGALSINDPNLNTPNSDDSHTYILENNPNGLFELSEDNQLMATNVNLLVKGDYPISIKVTDSTDLSFEKDFTITVTDDPKPTDIRLSNAIAVFDSPANTMIGELSTIDPTPNDRHEYDLIEDANGLFSISNNKLMTHQKLSQVGEYDITVRSTDKDNLEIDKNFTIIVKRMNLSNDTIFVDSDTNTKIGQFSTTMAFGNQPHTYLLKDDHDGLFWINDNDDLIIANADLLEINQYDITVRSIDNHGLFFEKDFTIIVTDDPTPTDIALSNTTAVLDSPVGTEIGKFSTSDPTPNDEHTYELTNDANGRFKIDDNQLIANQTLSPVGDYEIKVRSTDKDNLSVEKDFVITVTDAPNPIDIILSNTSAVFGTLPGTIIGELSTIDPTPNDEHTYELTDDANGRFKIDDNQLIANTTLSSAGEYQITVHSTDISGLKTDKNFTITVEPNTETEEEKIEADDSDDSKDGNTTPGEEEEETIEDDSDDDSEDGNTTTEESGNTQEPTVPNDGTDQIIDQQTHASLQFADDIFVVDEYATLSTTLPSQCLDIPERLLQPQEQTITLTMGDGSTPVIFQGGQPLDFDIIVDNNDIVTFEEPIILRTNGTLLRITPKNPGNTNIIMSDCASFAVIKVTVEADPNENRVYESDSPIVIETENTHITLTLGEGPLTLEIPGGQDIDEQHRREIMEQPDENIVTFNPIFPREGGFLLTLTPIDLGETSLVISDGFSEEQLTIEVIQPLCTDDPEFALRPEDNDIILEIGQEATFWNLIGGQGNITLTSSSDNIVQHQLLFTEDNDKLLKLTPQQVGDTKLFVNDECDRQVEITVTIASQCDTLIPDDTALPLTVEQENLILAAGKEGEEPEPYFITITGGQGDIEFTQSNEFVLGTLFSEAEEQLLRLIPQQAGKTTLSINDCFTQKEMAITVLPEPPNASGVDAQGEPIETTAYFALDITTKSRQNGEEAWFSNTDSIMMSLNLIVDPAHIGQAVSLIRIIIHQPSGQLFMQNGEIWQNWDGQLTSLVAASREASLSANVMNTITLPLDSLSIDPFEGELQLYLGYRLGDGTIIFNGQNPPHFNIASQGQMIRQGQPPEIKTSARFKGELRTDTGRTGHHLILSSTETVTANFIIQVDEAHIGQPANLIIAAAHAEWGILSLQSEDNWHVWDGFDFATLQVIEYSESLPSTVTMNQTVVSNIPVQEFAGEWAIYAGYRLETLENSPSKKAPNLEEIFNFDEVESELNDSNRRRQRQTQDENIIIFNGTTPLRLSIQY